MRSKFCDYYPVILNRMVNKAITTNLLQSHKESENTVFFFANTYYQEQSSVWNRKHSRDSKSAKCAYEEIPQPKGGYISSIKGMQRKSKSEQTKVASLKIQQLQVTYA
ncbi:hypothetical protein FGO68_gene6729 [Halteria grandinella]|uniref:Uncharacterized protein n=1 Tax=Halteria grandinella TaxID=5974 RepID=A0A8J8P8Q0_HALGN|nr:hypothetical protein FGO68_gene6729 [Halteria grandinella]